jgi:hypothetical protein
MRKLIKKILKEQWEEPKKLSVNLKNKVWKLFDKIGVEKSLPHFDFELDTLAELVSEYYSNNPNPKNNIEFDFFFTPDTIADLFSSDMQDIVRNYLNNDWEYDFNECFDYDGSWMLDAISEENMSFMRKSAIRAVGDDEDEIEDYIGERFGSVIGCTHSEAQQDADTAELHKDIDTSIEDFFRKLNGKWEWDKKVFDGKISVSELAESNFFSDVILDELEYGSEINWDDIHHKIMEHEFDYAGYAEGILFPEKMYFDDDKHFRYGGAGDMDKEYFNELLYDRLQEEIDVE